MGRLKGSKDIPKDATSKTCPGCGIEKSFSEFGKNSYNTFGLATRCRKCANADKRKRNRDFPDIIRDQNLRKKFNITIDEYDLMMEEQEGTCAICNRKEVRKNMYGIKRLSVDHNHITGKVRGLLCNDCNQGIGFLRSDEGVDLLLSAVEYMRRNNG